MSKHECKTCTNYQKSPIVKMEGICTDQAKAIYIAGSRDNGPPRVFDFAWCNNYEADGDNG